MMFLRVLYWLALIKLSVWFATEILGSSLAAVSFVSIVFCMLVSGAVRLVNNIDLAGKEALASKHLNAPVKLVYKEPNTKGGVLLLIEHDDGHYLLRPGFEGGFSIYSDFDALHWHKSKLVKEKESQECNS